MKQFSNLIENLVRDLKPIKTKSWKIPCFIWCSLFLFLILGNYSISTLLLNISQKNILEMVFHPVFISGVLTFLSSFIYVIFSSLPGRNYLFWKKLSYAFFFFWSLLIVINSLLENEFRFELSEFLYCGTGTILFSFLLLPLIVFIAKKRYILDWNSVIIGGILTSSISATLCIGFMCQNDTYSHIFYAHFFPVFVLIALVFFVAYIRNRYL
ncbi:MAG: hypothetical protein ACK4UJ_07475 [Leptonema sp. (in: bacteria)]